MSQFSTMTTRERKMQAAAICREVQAQEDVEADLGRKMNVPKDIMLEELSLASNRGSRLFKIRQRRSEKYTFESIRNENNKLLSDTAVSCVENGSVTDAHCSEDVDRSPDEARVAPDPESIAQGYGGPLKDVPPEKFNCTAVPKAYQSPWEQAAGSDPAVAHSLAGLGPQPGPQPGPPGYKCFNRVATPFGGFSGTPRPVPLRPVQPEPLPHLPEPQGDAAGTRPSFNRAALGWAAAGGPPERLIPESDDL
ncbi:myozenin-2a [Betta splendens]|uniref:Myozenin-2a n=1 Tax=Betta splendens TaxID=158456 RepID=A0A6P7PU66_BETSP|nr:myozenin-2a [Betta splendens]